MQNFIEHLRNFNSKERFFLAGQILGNPGFTPAAEFREKLGDLVGVPVPADAFSAMDYHIDWLVASLNLARDADPAKIYPNDNKVIKGQQEDVDWLIAFQIEKEYQLILIEAKGVTGWTNKQMTSKADRLGDIFGKLGDHWPGVRPHFVLMSHSQSARLSVETWPYWMAPGSKIKWLELAIPTDLNRVYRCNEQGQEDRNGQYWKVKKR